MNLQRTPENRFTFVGLLPSDPAVATSGIDLEVLGRLRAIEAAERRKADNQATPSAARARHQGVATGISIALAAIEASGITIRTTDGRER